MKLHNFLFLSLLPLLLAAGDILDNGWKPCPLAWHGGIEPGSALDFSFLNHVPAGKYGFLKRVGDHFEFEKRPGKAVRFWGTNFAIEGPFPDKTLAPGIARTMAAQGVNIVRFHLYAARPTLLQSPDGGFNPEMLDKMFFLLAELKKNGIYIYMDLNDGFCYDWVLNREPTVVPQERLKAFSLYDQELKKSTKMLAKQLFTALNPYTGLSFADDPAVAIYELTNEHSMLTTWRDWRKDIPDGKFLLPGENERYRRDMTKLWHDFLKEQHLPPAHLPAHLNESAVSRRFGAELDTQYFREMIQYLRSIGVKVPVCGTNFIFSLAQLQPAQEADVIGNHDYWAHPNFSRKPRTYSQRASLDQPVWGGALLNRASLANCVLKGFPIVHGEWNFCYPNAYRCEGIPLAAAYAAYQDWDGMIFYGATGSCDDGKWERFLENPGIMIHSQQTDPATWGISQTGAAMFRRGDVAPAVRELDITLPKSAAFESDVLPFHRMPFLPELGRAAICFSENGESSDLGKLILQKVSLKERYFAVLELLGDKNSDKRKIVSDTGEIVRFSNPALLFVNTPKTQSVSGKLNAISETGIELDCFAIKSPMVWGSFNAVSCDGLPLQESQRILITAVGNAANTGEKLENGQVWEMGTAPVRIEPFIADIAWETSSSDIGIYELDPISGKRVRELPSICHGNRVHFKLDGTSPTIYYELAVK
ncbi:hypothetical protein KH017_16165 [bacterium]|nr:hypothetical protein [bacterium]